MAVLRSPWIQSRDRKLWSDHSPLTNHTGVWARSISGQLEAITHGSACNPSRLSPSSFYSRFPHYTPSHPPSICPTFNPIIWSRDPGAVIFIEFLITLLRLQLSAGDWSLRLGCGSRRGAGGMLRRVPGWEVQGSLTDFLHSTEENTGQQSSHL